MKPVTELKLVELLGHEDKQVRRIAQEIYNLLVRKKESDKKLEEMKKLRGHMR